MFLRAVLHLAESPAGLPIREALLVGVVEHLLTIDVEIRWEDIVDVPTGERRWLLCGWCWCCAGAVLVLYWCCAAMCRCRWHGA